MKVVIGKYPKNGEQKKSIRIDPWDTWSMYGTLADIIHPMLKQLKKTKHGAPYTDDDDVPEHLRSTNAKPKKNEWDTDQFHFKRWDWILGEMIWAFGEIAKDKEPDFWVVKPKYKFVELPQEEGKEKMTEMKRVRDGVLDEEKMKAYYNRRKNALRLFGKYYENLWD